MEIAGALSDCMSQSSAEGLSGPVYIAGHSLGGIMLETYIKVGFIKLTFNSPIPSEPLEFEFKLVFKFGITCRVHIKCMD